MSCYEINFDGLVGPTHNFSGLAYGNIASSQHAKQISDGLGMLVEHNVAAFYLWHGIYPDSKPVIRELRKMYPNPTL